MGNQNILFFSHLNRKKLFKWSRKIQSKVFKNYHLPYNKREVARLQAQFPSFNDVYAYITEGLLPPAKSSAQRILILCEEYIIIDQVLLKISGKDGESHIRLAVPQVLVPLIISLHHDNLLACHQGILRVVATIKQRFYFPHLHQQITQYIRTEQTSIIRPIF